MMPALPVEANAATAATTIRIGPRVYGSQLKNTSPEV